MIDLTLNQIEKIYFSEPVLKGITIEIQSGEHIGLIGDNGSGKTTLFNIIAGKLSFENGHRHLRSGLKIGYLEQMTKLPEDITCEAVIALAFEPMFEMSNAIRALENELESLPEDYEKILSRLGVLRENYEHAGGYDIELETERVCHGLNISPEMRKRRFYTLSGGEQARVSLAKLLVSAPDLLLLDEPTNHLDMVTIDWLEAYIKQFKGSVIIISHDRTFLDHAINKLYELKNGTLEVYLGNYSYYLEERVVRYERARKAYDAQQDEIRRMTEAAKRLRDWAKRGDNEMLFKKAKAMERRVERMTPLDRPKLAANDFDLDFKNSQKLGGIAIEIQALKLGFATKQLITSGECVIYKGEHIGIVGDNGSGKTTLIKALLTRHENIRVNASMSIGYLPQTVTFEDEAQNMVEAYNAVHPLDVGTIRNILACYGFYRDEVFKGVSTLSGGERMRLKLAMLVRSEVQILIMDEPTNHIDIRTREIVEQAITDFMGTVVFISHDRYFLNQCAHRIVEIYEQALIEYPFDFENYMYYRDAYRLKQQAEAQSDALLSTRNLSKGSLENPKSHKAETKQKDVPEKEAAKAKRMTPETKEKREAQRKATDLKSLETQIETLEKKLKLLEAEPMQSGAHYEATLERYEAIQQIENEIEVVMTEYYALLETK